MTKYRKQFLILWCAGMVGVLSFLLVDLDSLIQMIPVPEGEERPIVPPLLSILALIQPTILLTVAVVIGVVLAHRVSLAAPVVEAISSRQGIWESVKRQLVPGILGGVVGGLGIILIAYISRSYLPLEVAEKSEAFLALMPLATRLLYGGITEELLLRWGFLTLLVWLGWRVLQRSVGEPRPAIFVAAIILSSLVFGAGHLPIAYMLFPAATLALTFFVVLANSVFGLVAGFLYWKKGLESAVIAHMGAHLVMFAASRIAVYFG